MSITRLIVFFFLQISRVIFAGTRYISFLEVSNRLSRPGVENLWKIEAFGD